MSALVMATTISGEGRESFFYHLLSGHDTTPIIIFFINK